MEVFLFKRNTCCDSAGMDDDLVLSPVLVYISEFQVFELLLGNSAVNRVFKLAADSVVVDNFDPHFFEILVYKLA